MGRRFGLRGPWRAATPAMAIVLAGWSLAGCSSGSGSSTTTGSSATTGSVLLVGTFAGHKGAYATIQAAVNAAKPGDWILIAPGDYHETDDLTHTSVDPHAGAFGGVLITTNDIHLRGMSRSGVIVDGTKSGGSPCSAAPDEQQYGAKGSDGEPIGRNGIVVWKANDVSVENLTVCNFLAGTQASGNEIWWNGGADSGQIGLHGYEGKYLSATSTFYSNETTAAEYGIFSSNAQGPGMWNYIYASNFNDSGTYIGACRQVCDATIDHAWMEYNALGYSGTNSGGALVIENSQFDNNEDGLDTNTQIIGDPPAPQNGACPDGGTSPLTHTHSCWVFIHNYSHNNNNPDTPRAGGAAAGPTGTGMTLSGGRNDTVMDNTFADNGAWGILFVPYPQSGTPEDHQSCSGTGGVEISGFGCVYDPMNDALLHNTFSHNGYFGNPSNGDFGQITVTAGQPQNCFVDNTYPNGSAPADLEEIQHTCGPLTKASNTGGPLFGQVLCDTGVGKCPADAKYPQATKVELHPLPTSGLPSMNNPCEGVPANAWCVGDKPI